MEMARGLDWIGFGLGLGNAVVSAQELSAEERRK